jgi:hypothetical protein
MQEDCFGNHKASVSGIKGNVDVNIYNGDATKNLSPLNNVW